MFFFVFFILVLIPLQNRFRDNENVFMYCYMYLYHSRESQPERYAISSADLQINMIARVNETQFFRYPSIKESVSINCAKRLQPWDLLIKFGYVAETMMKEKHFA